MSDQELAGLDEQAAAEALDAFLTERLAGRPAPFPGKLGPDEAAFAADLVSLAEAIPFAPASPVVHRARVGHASRRAGRKVRWTLPQSLKLAGKSALFKRTVLALSSAAAFALLIFLALPLLSPQPGLAPLPSLAALSAYAQGGGTSGSGIFPGTTFVLNAALPSSPAKLPVYRQPELKPLTIAEVQRWAERFGLHGQVYRQRTQSSANSIWRATVFDGTRQLTATSGDWINYADVALRNTFDSTAAMSPQVVADSAKRFLEAHGLLDFPYRVEPVPNVKNMVKFTRLLDGKPVENAYIQVAVMPDGQVASVEYHPLTLEPAGQYPARSSQVAWQELTSGQLSSQMQYTVRQNQAGGATTGATRVWQPQYRAGQRADLYGRTVVYEPADGQGGPLILLNQFVLRGNIQTLADAVDPVHVWGTLQSDGKTIDVIGWEKDPAPVFSPFQGTIQRQGNLVLVQRADGKTFVLPNAPDNLPDGIEVSGGGRETKRTEGGYPVLDWTSIISPPNSLPTFSQSDGGTPFQGSGVVAPVQIVTPVPGRPVGLPTPPLATGQRVEGLEGWLLAYVTESADGKTRTLNATLAELALSASPGWEARLTGPGIEGIGKYDRLRVRVWGRFSIQNGESTIAVERYEKAVPDEHIQAWLGKEEIATVAGRDVAVFQSREGKRFVLAFSLRDPGSVDYMRKLPVLPGGPQQVLMEGVVRSETWGGYPVVEEISSHSDDKVRAMTDLKGYQLEPRPQVIRPRNSPMPGRAAVEHIELIYYAIANPMMGFSYKPVPDMAMRIVQPLWRFTGHSEDGASFEILVQAVSSQYVK